MSEPVSKAEKKRRILAALEGRAIPGNDLEAPVARKPQTTAKSAREIVGMMDASPRATSKVIGDYVDENPDKALAVFRSWLAE
jgi:hypothetical protein